MKKGNFYVKMAAVFLIGALLCGIGAGVCFAEWSSLETVKAEETAKTDERDYILPQNEILYLQGLPADVSTDGNIETGHMKIKVRCTENSDIHYYEYETHTLADYSGAKTRKWKVKVLFIPDVYTHSDDYEQFREMLEHLKNKEIYYHTDTEPEIEIQINPADRERIVCLWQHDNMEINYDEYDAADEYDEEEHEDEFEEEFEKELEVE